MNQATVETLGALSNCSWLSKVGTGDTEAVVNVKSWDQAIKYCTSDSWGNLQLEAANQLRERIGERNTARLADWNNLASNLKLTTIPLVKRKIGQVVKDNSLPKEIEDSIQWDVLHLGMECEYSDLVRPAFYAGLSYWYKEGRLPCGWEGLFPQGKLVVF